MMLLAEMRHSCSLSLGTILLMRHRQGCACCLAMTSCRTNTRTMETPLIRRQLRAAANGAMGPGWRDTWRYDRTRTSVWCSRGGASWRLQPTLPHVIRKDTRLVTTGGERRKERNSIFLEQVMWKLLPEALNSWMTIQVGGLATTR